MNVKRAPYDKGMKNRWIGVLVLAVALSLGACAPAQQGADETPDEAARSAEPSHSMSESMDSPSAAPSDDAGGNPDPTDYDYDY